MGGILMGKYAFSFGGSEVYLPANANDNDDAKCNSALKGLKSVESITCKRESFNPNTGTGSYLISLLSFPTKPHMNNLIHHNGNPGINLFACNTTKIDAEEAQQPFCFVSDAEPLDGFPRKCLSSLTPCRSCSSGATHMLFCLVLSTGRACGLDTIGQLEPHGTSLRSFRILTDFVLPANRMQYTRSARTTAAVTACTACATARGASRATTARTCATARCVL
jgi:hypothetical protein